MESKRADTHSKTIRINKKKNILYHIYRGPNLGLIYSMLFSLCYSLSSVIVKKMTSISPAQLSILRIGGCLVMCLPILVHSGQNLMGPRKYRLILFARGLASATAIYFVHMAYRHLPLAEAFIILSANPAMVMIGAILFLKETYGLVAKGALVLTFVGVLLSVNLPELLQNKEKHRFTVEYLGGIASAVGAAFCISAASLLTRNLKEVHFAVLLVYFGIMGVIENTCLTAAFNAFELPRCGRDSLLMMGVGILGFASNSFHILAVQRESVAIVSVVTNCLNVVISFILQIVFFGHIPSVCNYCGAVVVIIAVCAIGLAKWSANQPSGSELKDKFKLLLL